MHLANTDALGWTCALIVAIFVGLGLAVLRLGWRRRRSLAAAQARFGGTAVPEKEDDAGTATLTFEVEGSPAWLECDLGAEGSTPLTRLQVDVTSTVELVVEARGLLGSAGDPLGDDAFDGRFRVTTVPPERGRELLGPEARAALLALHDLGAGLVSKGVNLYVRPARSSITVPRDLLDAKPAVIVEFLERSLAVLRGVRGASD